MVNSAAASRGSLIAPGGHKDLALRPSWSPLCDFVPSPAVLTPQETGTQTSGYPVASLPAYLFTSSLVSLQLSRCCHDDTAKNAPHCYASAWAPLPQVLQKLTEDSLGTMWGSERRRGVFGASL